MRRNIFIVAALVGALLPVNVSGAQSTSIAFVNPSGYTSPTQPRLLSAKTDSNSTYHLVAWVKNAPAQPVVEFELRPTAVGNTTTVTATRVGGTNTWEYNLELGGIADGSYSLTAQLYSGVTPVADDAESVTVNNSELPPPDEANTVELLFPENGGRAGYFTPTGKSAGFVVHSMASEGTGQVRVLYSLSDTGNDPEWKQCASGTPNADRIVTVRCAIATGDRPAEVTAIAAVANRTPTGDPSPAADESGDAHQVLPYAQVPSSVEINPPTVMHDPAGCQRFTLEVVDQDNRPIPGVNVDVHAVGPDDNLTFATANTTIPGVNETDPFQAPDRAHTTERTRRCSDGAFQDGQLQGESNRPGGVDDEKHIESTSPASSLGGTDIGGHFDFALYSGTGGSTQLTAWADVNDDDLPGASEAAGGAQLGWGQAPPPPVTEITLSPSTTDAALGECVRLAALARRGGNALGAANVDVHIVGPDASVAFCAPTDASPSRTPDSGSHVTGGHEDGTKHLEGETASTGEFVFGVTSSTAGGTNVSIWVDQTEDDTESGEPGDAAQITWQVEGDRTITLASSRARVRK
ncbi:MAG: hypothetical protein M3271_01560, partial [Actinomycetota bacterium]|nr:hypothetical protein [Actinomycetota bacterium]